MRYRPAHKAATRRRILDAAAAALRARGLEHLGVAEVMGRAGLTHGGFYAHFPSRDALVTEACDAALEQSLRRLRRLVERAEGPALDALVAAYLSPEHRDHPERGCPLPALGSELARGPAGARKAVRLRLEAFVGFLAELLPSRRGASRRREALGVLACLVGAMTLARAVDDDELSREVLGAACEFLARRR